MFRSAMRAWDLASRVVDTWIGKSSVEVLTPEITQIQAVC